MLTTTYRFVDLSSSGDVTYEEMVSYVDSQVATISGTGGPHVGLGDIVVTQSGGVTYVDGTHLIAEDGDVVDGGTF